jgi:hypothetical protein
MEEIGNFAQLFTEKEENLFCSNTFLYIDLHFIMVITYYAFTRTYYS